MIRQSYLAGVALLLSCAAEDEAEFVACYIPWGQASGMVESCDEWTLDPNASTQAREEFKYLRLVCQESDGLSSEGVVRVAVSHCPEPPEFIGSCTVTDWHGYKGITRSEFIYLPSERHVPEAGYLQYNERAEQGCTTGLEEGVYEPSATFDSNSES